MKRKLVSVLLSVSLVAAMLMCGKEAQKQNRYRQSPRAIP